MIRCPDGGEPGETFQQSRSQDKVHSHTLKIMRGSFLVWALKPGAKIGVVRGTIIELTSK